MNAAKSTGVPVFGSAESLASAAFTSAPASPSLINTLSFATTSRGVPAGASTPAQASSETSGKPCSISVGTPGRSGQRAPPATATGRSLLSVRPILHSILEASVRFQSTA